MMPDPVEMVAGEMKRTGRRVTAAMRLLGIIAALLLAAGATVWVMVILFHLLVR